MATAKEFPPEKVRAIVGEVASLLKERKESVCVAETVCFLLVFFSAAGFASARVEETFKLPPRYVSIARRS